jgi:hypothetical protein
MARKIVDIGVEGNDGTGDSIREGFRKVNDNFSEIYAVFGQEGTLSFLSLGDVEGGTVSSYSTYKDYLPIVNSPGTGIEFKKLVGENGLTISYPDSGLNQGMIVLTQQSATGQLGSNQVPGLFGNSVNGQDFTLGNIADPTPTNVALWNSKFGYNTEGTKITQNKFPVTVGYADQRYVNRGTEAGVLADTMIGYLAVPPGATGDQVAQSAETVLKSGSTMGGPLFLSDHPGDLAGAGTPFGADDKQAATKYYVDTTAYSSKVNLYVSTNGDDEQRKTPVGKEGRAMAYAYKTLVSACLKAEQLIDESPFQPGPYRQLIAYGGARYYSEVLPSGIIVGGGLNGSTRIIFTNDNGSPVDQGVQANKDIIPGKLVVGKNSEAQGFIVKYGTITGGDYVDLRDVIGSFEVGENLYFDQPVKRLEITIFVESGNYNEDYPIRIPRNCSIVGDEFRRTVIRPADRVSQSPWASTWFYRDLIFDNLTIAETNWGYHYLTDATNKASTPKNNKDIDVFLCNDATIIRQISCQGHGGFMMVLDPNGQILTKSPYCQQSGSFSGSLNTQAFRGGQYVDGQAGSMPVATVNTNLALTEITVTDSFRVPQTPTAFFVKGIRYKIDTFTNNGQGNRGYSDLLLLNKEFIVAETIAYINDVITPAFSYNPDKCRRDVGYIINAVAYDIAFGSNIQSINTALEYYIRDGYTIFPGQKGPTLDAINFVKTRLLSLLTNDASSSAKVTDKMNVILQILEFGIGGDPKVFVSATSWTYATTSITVTKNSHGLRAGWSINVIDSSTSTSTNAPNGFFNITAVTENTFTYTAPLAPTGTASGTLRYSATPIPLRSIPQPPANPQVSLIVTDGVNNSLAILLANREMLKAEFLAKINNIAPDFTFGSVGVVGYIRDIDRIVNAVIYDSIYGGNSQSVLAVKNYFDIANTSTISREVNQITEALSHVREIAFQVTTNTLFSGLFLQIAQPQVRGTAGTVTVANIVKANFNIIINSLTAYSNIPTSVSPAIDFIDSFTTAAYATLRQNSESVQTATIEFINNKYLYNQALAARDVRFLVNDLAHDIVYTGNLKMVEHGLSYFVGEAKFVSDTDRPRTLAIIDYVNKLALKIVDNDPVPDILTIKAGGLTIGTQYVINTPGTTIWTALGATDNIHNTQFTATGTGLVSAGLFVVGRDYTIVSQGNLNNQTNFINIGASNNTVGTAFTATGIGTGTGSATQGTGNVILASSDRFYIRQRDIEQKNQLVSAGLGAPELIPSRTWVTSDLTNAYDVLQDQRLTIQNQLIAWIDENIASANNPLNPITGSIWYDFEYNSATCKRDVGYIVDAIGYDTMFGSNFQSIIAGLAYFRGTTSNAVVQNSQKVQTIASFNQLKVILVSFITNNLPANERATALGRVVDRMEDIIDIVSQTKPQGADALWLPTTDTVVMPEPSDYSADYRGAKEFIKANRSFIVTGITGWIAAQIAGPFDPFTSGFTYDSARCARDVGFILDAIVYDLTYGGNTQTRIAANSYFVGVISQLADNDNGATIATYERLQEVIGLVARAVAVPVTYTSTGQTLVISGVTGGGALTSAAFAQDRVNDVIKTLKVTNTNSKPTLTSLITTTRTMVANTQPSGFVAAKDLLVANREFIKAEVVNYLNYQYTFTITQSSSNQFQTYNTANMRVGMPVKFTGTDPFSATILSATTPLEVNSAFIVTFTFARVGVRPDNTKDYEILNNANPLYNIIVPVANAEQSSTRTDFVYITVAYPSNPGVFDYANVTTIRVAGGVFGGISKDAKYYVQAINSSTNRFTISNTFDGTNPGSPITLDSDSGTMYCSLAYNQATCSRDVGFIVSNISTDILYGGRYNTIKAGKRYLVASDSATLVRGEQSIETRAGIAYINTLAQQVINNTASTINTVVTTYQVLNGIPSGSRVSQVIKASITGGSVAGTAISGLVTLVNNIILYGKTWAESTINIPDAVVYPKYVLQLNEDTPYNIAKSGSLPSEIVIQGAGNTSMLSNDWTQLNDLAYGLVATNNGLIETVSVFTYYCWTAYYARNGGQIRSVGGSNAHGEYACVAEGSDPFEVPDGVTLVDDMVQTAVVFKEGPFAAEMALTKTTIFIDSYEYPPYNAGEVEINHGYTVTDSDITDIGVTRYEISSINDVSDKYFSVSVSNGTVITTLQGNGKYKVQIPFPNKTYVPAKEKYYFITGNTNSNYNNNFNGWLCIGSDSSYIILELTDVPPGTWGTASTTIRLKPGSVLRLNLNTSGSNNTSASGLQKALENNQLITVRSNQNFKFSDVDEINPTRPSTALTWRADPTNSLDSPVARVIAFNINDPLNNKMRLESNTISNASSSGLVITVTDTTVLRVGMIITVVSGTGAVSVDPVTTVTEIVNNTTFKVSTAPSPALNKAVILATSLNKSEVILTFDSGFSYVIIQINQDYNTLTEAQAGIDDGSTTKTLGSQQGDMYLAVDKVTSTKDLNRISTGQMVFAWNGRLHRIVSYISRNISSTEGYGIIKLSEDRSVSGVNQITGSYQNLSSYVGTGISAPTRPGEGYSLTNKTMYELATQQIVYTYTGDTAPNAPLFNGSISGSILTVNSISVADLLVGSTIQNISGSGISTGTKITGQITSTEGGSSSYSIYPNVTTTTISASVDGNAITLASNAGLVPNIPIVFTGSNFSTIVSGVVYFVKTVTTTTAVTNVNSFIFGTTLTIGSMASGTIAVGMILSGSNITSGTYIVSNISGSGAGSTWLVSVPHAATGNQAITGSLRRITISSIAGGSTFSLATTVGSITVNAGSVIGSSLLLLLPNSISAGATSKKLVTGTGIPVNTYVSETSTGDLFDTIKLSNNFTSNATGTYSFFTAGQRGTYNLSASQSTITNTNMGVNYTVYGNSNASYNLTGPVISLSSADRAVRLSAPLATIVANIETDGKMTVTAVSGNTIQLGQTVYGTSKGSLNANIYVTSFISGTGGVGTYQLSLGANNNTPVFTASGSSTTLTVSAITIGKLLVDSTIQKTTGTGIALGTTITGQLTSNITTGQGSTTITTGTISTNTITVNDPTNIVVGQLVTGSVGIPANTYVGNVNLSVISLVNHLGIEVNLTANITVSNGLYTFRTANSTGTYSMSAVNSFTSTTLSESFSAIPGSFGSGATRLFPSTTLYNPELVQDNTISLRIGLSKGEPADIIVNISTCRVTGHDFSEIGSGGYNQTNYPNKVYGIGKEKNQKKEVAERGTGRVFWVSTDQDGFFRVGRFFTVDQGTGTVSFAASLALSNLDGLGFKRGKVINEFSDDDTFQDLSPTKAPVEVAIDGYINKRLGMDRANIPVNPGSTIGFGFLDRGGVLEMEDNLKMGDNRLLNLANPEDDKDGVNKRYVDNQQLSDNFVNVDGQSDNNILIYNGNRGGGNAWVNATTSTDNSQIQVDLIAEKEANIYVKRGTVYSSHLNRDAHIGLEKLDINTSIEQRDVGTLISSVTKSVPLTIDNINTSITDASPNIVVTISVNEDVVKPTVGIYYTVSGNGNSNANGTYLCIESSARVGGVNAYIKLSYVNTPGAFGADGIITPHETAINTQLVHSFSAGDIVSISGTTVDVITPTINSGTQKGSFTITASGGSAPAGVAIGQLVTGTGVPPYTYVKNIDLTTITLTNKLVATTAGTYSFSTSVNGSWPIASVLSTTSFVINVDTRGTTGAYTVTDGRVTKLGLATFNKGQFNNTNGFVELSASTTSTITANITAGSTNVTNVSSMNNISVGSVITIASGGGTVTMLRTTAGAPVGTTNIVQDITVTVTAITSATSFTVSTAFAGTGAATGVTLTVIVGTALSNIQQIGTDKILGNLSGSQTTPVGVTTGEIVKAGDGIKNATFNVTNRVGYSGGNANALPNANADLTVEGVMTLKTRDLTDPWKNTYGVFQVTYQRAANSIVRTNASGQIDATAYLLDEKLAFDTLGSNIDFYTPGGAKFITGNGDSGAAATPVVSVGTYSSALSGITATANTVTSGVGSITVSSVANMYIGQEIKFNGNAFGGLSPDTVYWIRSINTGNNSITLTTNDTVSAVAIFAGVTASGGAMTVSSDGVLNGQLFVPRFKAFGEVTLNPINTNVSIQPRSSDNLTGGTVIINPAVNGKINNMTIGDTIESPGRFTTVTVTSITNATGSADAPLKTAGGLAVGTNAYVGTDLFVGRNLVLTGDLTVKGTTTSVNSNEVNVADKNIVLASVGTSSPISATITSNVATSVIATGGGDPTGLIPGMVITRTAGTSALTGDVTISEVRRNSTTQAYELVLTGNITNGTLTFTAAGNNNTTANGGGITLKAAADKTITWLSSNDKWNFNVGITAPDIKITEGFESNTLTINTLTVNANSTLGNATSDTITVNSQFVAGTKLKTATDNTNTLALSAFAVGGTTWTDLVTLTAAASPKLDITSTAVGTITNMSIGSSNHSTGKFTTLDTTETATFGAAVTMTAADKNVTFSPTGTGTVTISAVGGTILGNGSITISPGNGTATTTATASSGNNVTVTSTVGMAVNMTAVFSADMGLIRAGRVYYILTASGTTITLTATNGGTVAFVVGTTTGLNVTVTTGNVGKVEIQPFEEGKITNMSIGSTSPKSAAFTTLAANDLVTLTKDTDAAAITRNVQGAIDNWDTVTGAVKVTGGMLVQKALRVGGTIYAPAFDGSFTGNASSASQIRTETAGDANASYYITFVNSNNAANATNAVKTETVYTDGSLSFNASTNTLTVDAITSTVTKATNLVGGNATTLLGSIPYQSGADATAMLAPNISSTVRKFLASLGDGTNGVAPTWREIGTSDINGFSDATDISSSNAGSATKLQTARSFTISGVVTASAQNFDGSGNVTLTTSYSTTAPPAASVATTELTASGVTAYYLPMTATAPATASTQNIMRTSGNLYYKPGDSSGEPTAGGLYAGRFHGNAMKALYADLAENYQADDKYAPGTVVVFGGEFEVTQSTVFNDRRIAGVVSTEPAYLMNTALKGENVAEVALTGRVPCKVIGRVKKGDLLVTSGKPGYAIVNNDPKVGTVIGKALENKTTDGDGVIEVVVGKN